MLRRFTLSLGFTLALAGAPALAQSPSETGTGGGPTSTLRAPNTTAVGQTKPPGNAAGPGPVEERDDRDRAERRNDAIDTGICIGCDK